MEPLRVTTHLVCRACSVAARPRRRCLDCGKLADSKSPLDGREDVCMGTVAIYTRLRCAACLRADPLSGTLGAQGAGQSWAISA